MSLRLRIKWWFERQKAKLPGWVLVMGSILLWAYTGIPDLFDATHFWIETAKAMGGRVGLIATIIDSPWFHLSLFILGVLYLRYVGEVQRPLRHPAWPILGWAVVVAVALTFWSVLVAGYVVGRAPQQMAEKLTAQINKMKAQHAPRHIKDLKRFISMLYVFRGQRVDVEHVAMDREAENFIGLIRNVVELSGWTIGDAAAMSGQTWDGVIIEVNDLREAMPAAYELKRLLTQQGTAAVIKPRSGPRKPGQFTIRVGYKMPGEMTN